MERLLRISSSVDCSFFFWCADKEARISLIIFVNVLPDLPLLFDEGGPGVAQDRATNSSDTTELHTSQESNRSTQTQTKYSSS